MRAITKRVKANYDSWAVSPARILRFFLSSLSWSFNIWLRGLDHLPKSNGGVPVTTLGVILGDGTNDEGWIVYAVNEAQSFANQR